MSTFISGFYAFNVFKTCPSFIASMLGGGLLLLSLLFRDWWSFQLLKPCSLLHCVLWYVEIDDRHVTEVAAEAVERL